MDIEKLLILLTEEIEDFRYIDVGNVETIRKRIADLKSQILSAFAELQDKTRWIPVTEYLPKVNQKVLVFSVPYSDFYPKIGYQNARDEWVVFGKVPRIVLSDTITYWMPIPKPPDLP